MLDQTFHAAQTGRSSKNLCARRDFHGRFAAAFHFKREHSAEHRHLLLRDLVAGVRLQAGIMHVLDFAVGGKKLGQPGCVLRMRAHPPGQRSHSAQDQPTIERRGDRAAFILNVANALEKIAVAFCNHNSAQNVAMAAKIFCGGVKNKVGAEIERSLKNGRPGIVANAERTGVMHNFCNFGQIDNFEQRIGGRFHPGELRFWTQRFFDRGQVAHIDEIGLKSPTQENFAEQSRRAIVGVHVREHVIARRERLKNCAGRARARGKRGRAGAALEHADSLLQRLAIRIVVARIHEAARVGAFHVALERGGKVNGR